MHWIEPSTPLTIVFAAIVAGVVIAFLAAVRRVAPERLPLTAGLLVVWLAITGLLAGSGQLEAQLPFSLFAFMGASNLLALGVALSPLGRRLATLPLATLVGFHAFRLPLEVVLHRLHAEGTLPVTMTWEGRNLDVITGVLALLLIPLLRGPVTARTRALAMAFNGIGLALLLNVMVTAILSSPVPFRRFMAEPALQLAFHVPWVWIVPVCVAGALGGHVVLFRALRSQAPAGSAIP